MLTDHEDREPDRPLGWGMRLLIGAMITLQLLMFGMMRFAEFRPKQRN